jgi:hypothetical protein
VAVTFETSFAVETNRRLEAPQVLRYDGAETPLVFTANTSGVPVLRLLQTDGAAVTVLSSP